MRLPLSQELLVYRLKDGLVDTEATEGLMASLEARIDLTDELIENDAMIFKRSVGPWVDLYVPGRPGRLRFTAKGWPYFGIWSKKGSPFVCLEPWHGIADSINTTQEFTEKEGIIKLAGGSSWKAAWAVELKA
jgi:galactose mutarotase-like enzyme